MTIGGQAVPAAGPEQDIPSQPGRVGAKARRWGPGGTLNGSSESTARVVRVKSPTQRREAQRAFWRFKYEQREPFFGESESAFARYCLKVLRREPSVREVVELGSGYGRDARFLAECGYSVTGVDVTGGGAHRSVLARRGSESARFVEGDALRFLDGLPAGGSDAVYSNMFFNMDYTRREHRRLLKAIHRVLRESGLHLYSARSTTDPWYGRGRKVRPDTFDFAPNGVTMHFFSKEYADEVSEGLFEPVSRREQREGKDDFPIRLLYVVDRKAHTNATTVQSPKRRSETRRRSRDRS